MRFGLPLGPQHRIYAAFAVYAFSMGNIFPRLPDIKAAMGVQEGALGLSLIGTPLGTLVSLTVAAPFLERIGFRRALLPLIPLVALGYAIASHAPSPLAFFLLLFPVGVLLGCVEIILNVEADRTEFLVGRRIMNRAHSFWSIGFFSAGLFGGVVAHLGVPVQIHLALVVLISILGVTVFLGGYQPSPKRETSQTATPKFARPTGAILVLVAVTLSAMLMEGASLDWSAIYMRNVFEAGPFLAAFAVAVFAFCQATTRFFADSFVDRHSPAAVARTLIVVMAVGIVLVFFSPMSAVSLLGFAMLGVGSGTLFPLAVSAAAQRTDRPAAINVAALTQIAFVVFLLGPPLLGFVAEHWGIRSAFGLGLPLVVVSFLTAGSLGKKPVRPKPEGEAVAKASAHQDAF
ncbi:MFS transporter [Mesorhizobium sp. BR1-1-16]|uniref:MFS transporter n=1 Tax=Mesorhizobium sp. BR1-1-16 TaxID=2876653 RepID=UPI001CC9A138|nr:MFS transporter [Mesorhizobium sp. BR1-1-16]MBZ9935443.1 MFS transporter [Mesorhizobium sp. BR1-1-16]